MIERQDYAPYHLLEAFEAGVYAYRCNNHWSRHCYKGLEAKAYDRGCEFAMRIAREVSSDES